MKDLSKRFINIHSGLGPLATVEASKGVLVEQHNQQVGPFSYLEILMHTHIYIYPTYILTSSFILIDVSPKILIYPHIFMSPHPHLFSCIS